MKMIGKMKKRKSKDEVSHKKRIRFFYFNVKNKMNNPKNNNTNNNANKYRSQKRRAELSDEVKDAVNDILHGTNVGSHTEWLQREYIRLMRREAAYKRENESKLENNNTNSNANGGPSE